MGYLIK